MAGYVIHLAVAEEYLKKTKIKENYNEFIEGVIAPDGVKDKSQTHYGEKSSLVNLNEFLKDKKLDNSFNRGYFLHLVTDYIFYNKVLDTFSKEIYNDYDILNSILMEKYNVKLPERVKDRVFFKKGELKLLSLEKAEKCIQMSSSMEIDEIVQEIDNPKYSNKWLEIRELKHI